jgi:chromosome segregation ATPase
MANPTKDQLTINALRERVNILENTNKKLTEFHGFIEEHKIQSLERNIVNLYSRLRHSKIVYKRYVKQDLFNNKMVKAFYEGEIERIKQSKSYKEIEQLKQDSIDLQICRDAIKNKNEIINKQKDTIKFNNDIINSQRSSIESLYKDNEYLKNSISDYKSKLMKSNTNLTDTVKRYTERFNELEERIQELDNESIMLNNDIGIKQRTIEALKLENKEVNNKLKISDKIFYFISIPYLVVSAIYLVITLIK